jgi:hypothetical protein
MAADQVFEEHTLFAGRKFFVTLYHNLSEKQCLQLLELYFPKVGTKRSATDSEEKEVSAPQVRHTEKFVNKRILNNTLILSVLAN